MMGLARRCALAAMLCAATLQAQNPTGTLRGIVQDSTRARIAYATVAVHLRSTSQTRTAVCDDRGEFRIDGLAPGTWDVTVSARGFADAATDVQIEVSAIRDVVVTMSPGGVRQSVNVEAHASSITTQPIDVASQVHQGVITRQDLETLPLAARSFANIAYLAPGTEPVEPSDPTKAHHGCFHRRQFWLEQRAFGGWSRQFGRLYRGISTELLARFD